MSANYYYFVSSLPHIRPGDEPPMGSEDFLEQCRYQLPPDIAEQLAYIALEPSDDEFLCHAHQRWNAFETSLRNVIVQARASRLKKEAVPFLKPEADAFGGLEGQVQEALNRDPLDMEQQLDRVRWQFLGDLTVGHEFDINALFVYRIKLLLLEKRSGMSTEQGQVDLEQCLKEKLTSDQLPEFING